MTRPRFVLHLVLASVASSTAALAQTAPGPSGSTPPAPAAPPAAATAAPAAPPAAPATPPAAEAPPSADEAAKKEEARAHFEKGLLLFDDEAWDAALAEFAISRQIFPTRSATKNAAISLKKLHRFDEALAMFEELLRFANLPPADRELAERELRTLQGLVGTVEIRGGEPGASVVVDGRDRGVLPVGPVRVAVGSHVVRIYKEGHLPFETRVDVAGGKSASVDARLPPLTQSGRLKVSEQTGKVLEVVVDGIVVGKTPWEGPLAPGEHTVLLRGAGNLGTQPASAPVTLNQITPLTLQAEELGASLRVEPTPAGATVAIDGVTVGRGLWEGKLRPGAHKLEVAAEGFLPLVRELTLASGQSETIKEPLARDPSSEMWSENRPRFFVEVDGAFALVPSLGGDVADCDDPCSKGLGMGFLVVGHGAYRLRNGLMFGIHAGYMRVSQDIEGRSTAVKPTGLAPNPGTADDSLTLGGVLLGASAGYHLGQSWPATFRLGAGVLLGSLDDERTGAFTTVARPEQGTAATPYDVDASESVPARYFYVAPEIRLAKRLGDFELSAGVQALVLIALSQPTWKPDEQPISASVDGFGLFPSETLAGKVVVAITPGLGARYDF